MQQMPSGKKQIPTASDIDIRMDMNEQLGAAASEHQLLKKAHVPGEDLLRRFDVPTDADQDG